MKQNSVAVLMPVASLIGGAGIGDFGESSYKFIDQLADIGVKYWQVLPLGILDKYGCPYASPSAFGLEPLLIDLASLTQNKSKEHFDIKEGHIDYEVLRKTKRVALNEYASQNIKESVVSCEIQKFTSEKFWVAELAVFLTLSEQYGPYWTAWPNELKNIDFAKEYVNSEMRDIYLREVYLQKLAYDQWQALRKYARNKNVEIIGDLPIFVSADSSDSWRWGEIFKRDQVTGKPLVITGAPPDAFSETGQLWGTLNYEWQKETPKVLWWWNERIRDSLELYDLVRIDHFIGLYHVWESDPHAPDAASGQWVKSEGDKLLESIKSNFPNMPFIAEDLGALSREVSDLRKKYHLPSMKVFQFSINETLENEHLPCNVPKESIYYSATHDNNTLVGWLNELYECEKQKELLAKRLGQEPKDLSVEQASAHIIKVILESKSKCCVFQTQDIMGLDTSARINVPGTLGRNWNWKMSESDWSNEKWTHFANKIKESGRDMNK